MMTSEKLSGERGDLIATETTLALIGVAMIALIVLINVPSRPLTLAIPHTVSSCQACGTVVAVRRSAHSAPVFFVEIQMLDGSTRTVQQLAAGFNVGDIVQVNGNALTLRTS